MTFRLNLGVCSVRDVERDVRAVYVLGEASEVFASPVAFGSDDSCEVVIDHPDVPARAVEFYPRGHHFYSRRLPNGQGSRGGEVHRFGPYEVAAYHTERIEPHGAVDLPVRFAARELGRAYAPSVGSDPRTIEARRLLAAIDAAPPCVLDSELQQWCEDRVEIHFNALTWATTPRHSLAHGRIIFATHLDDALARYALAWSGVETVPFDRAAWAHVHRMDLWTLGLATERPGELAFAMALVHQLPASQRIPEPLRRIAADLAVLQVMTTGDDVSPVRPLAALLERGIVPIALPDGTLMLFATTAEPVADRDIATELAFVAALDRDPAGRTVYADFLEQRGDAGQARRLRAGAQPSPHLVEAQARFDHAPILLGESRGRQYREAPDLPRATEPPTATLEISGQHHALGIATHFAVNSHVVRVVPAYRVETILCHADGLWLHGTSDGTTCEVNGRRVWHGEAMPLFDGDVIRIVISVYSDGRTTMFDATAILHDA